MFSLVAGDQLLWAESGLKESGGVSVCNGD